jgi:hypothetical protein
MDFVIDSTKAKMFLTGNLAESTSTWTEGGTTYTSRDHWIGVAETAAPANTIILARIIDSGVGSLVYTKEDFFALIPISDTDVFYACNGRFYTGSFTHQLVFGAISLVSTPVKSSGWLSEKIFTAPDNKYAGTVGIDVKAIEITATGEIFMTNGKNAQPYVMLIKKADGTLNQVARTTTVQANG